MRLLLLTRRKFHAYHYLALMLHQKQMIHMRGDANMRDTWT
jgi:hypothetical protein